MCIKAIFSKDLRTKLYQHPVIVGGGILIFLFQFALLDIQSFSQIGRLGKITNGIQSPRGVAIDGQDILYVISTADSNILRVNLQTGLIDLVEEGILLSTKTSPPDIPKLKVPYKLALDRSGNLYVTDIENRIIRIDLRTREKRVIAGNGKYGYNGEYVDAKFASFRSPEGLVIDAKGNIIVVDANSNRVRRIDSQTHLVTTVAGTGDPDFNGDGILATSAALQFPASVTLDSKGNVLIADTQNGRIRKVDIESNIIATVAGDGRLTSEGDGGLAIQASLCYPNSIVVDSTDNLYILESGSHRVRLVDAKTRIITTIAGTGEPGYSGDGGLASKAKLNGPLCLAIDKADNLYIADWKNHRVRKVDAKTRIISTVVGPGL